MPIKMRVIQLDYKLCQAVVAYEVVQAIDLPVTEFAVNTVRPITNSKLFTQSGSPPLLIQSQSGRGEVMRLECLMKSLRSQVGA